MDLPVERPGSPLSAPEPAGPPLPVDLRDWVQFSTTAATRVRVLASASLAVDLWCLEPQQATPVIALGEADVTYTVVAGRSWFVTEAGEVGLDPLGALLVPAGTAHGIDNRAPDPLIVVAVSSPPSSEAVGSPVASDGRAVRDMNPRRNPVTTLTARLRRTPAEAPGARD
jgi:quercetin dioxygenase-like cupin family protein